MSTLSSLKDKYDQLSADHVHPKKSFLKKIITLVFLCTCVIAVQT